MDNPYQANERWEYWTDATTGKRYAKVTGRVRVPQEVKTWAWAFANDYEQQLPDWYHPEWDPVKRAFYWSYLRNPLQNWRAYGGPPFGGVQDRNFTVEVIEGNPDPMVIQRNDVIDPATGQPGQGYQRTRLFNFEDDPSLELTFTSYCGPKTVWYYGWQPSGFYGAKLNFS